MKISYYTIDDVSVGPGRPFQKGWKLERFPTLEEALAHYRTLSSAHTKAMGLTDGIHILELVECLPMVPDDQEGEDVLSSDHRLLPWWENEPEAIKATSVCISTLRLRYIKEGALIVPIQPSDMLAKNLRDKYLWLNADCEKMSAIRWVYVAGKGWVSMSMLRACSQPYPLVLKYRADGITAQGAYLALEMEPWEYELLLRRTLERLEQNQHKEEQKK